MDGQRSTPGVKVVSAMGSDITEDQYFSFMQSILHVSLAACGGTLAGLSIARRGGGVASLAARKGRRRQQFSRMDDDLPALMGMSCATFVAVLEGTKAASLSSMIIDATAPLVPDPFVSTIRQEKIIRKNEFCSILDYTLGGAIAGGIFRQAAVSARTKTALKVMKSNKVPAELMQRNTLPGMVSGAGLGLCAGTVMFGLGRLQDMLDEYAAEHDDIASDAQVSQSDNSTNELTAFKSNNALLNAGGKDDMSSRNDHGHKDNVDDLTAAELKQRIAELKKKLGKA